MGPRETNTASYRCLQCGHKWRGDPGPVTCPSCGHDYVKWENYQKTFSRTRVEDHSK